MTDTVQPRLSRGFRDLLPDQMLARQQMVDTIRGVYENYGFVPISTPAVEYLDVLSGSAGAEAQRSIFRVTNPEKEELGLRFDLTVPLARLIAEHRQALPRPFRRYQVASVWRADKPDKGRYREFTQFDLDSVGVESEVADTEIIAGMCDTLSALQVGPYLVRFSSRQILNLLLAYAGIGTEQGVEVFRVLDKLDKVGLEKIKLELMEGYKDESGDTIRGVGLAREQVTKIETFLGVRGSRKDVLTQVRDLFGGVAGAPEQLDVVERISNHLYSLGYGDDRVSLDVSIARGLAYYTGPVFEAILLDAPQFGSVFGGGRYDDLVMRFLNERIPAVGASIGVDRLLAALTSLGRIGQQKATARVLITDMDRALRDDYIAMTWELRRAGIPTELYLGSAKGPGKQLKYADQYHIPLAILYGSQEKEQGTVTIKDLVAGRERMKPTADRKEYLAQRAGQLSVPRTELVETITKMLQEVSQ
ncbi:MAG TPA: histidine--tRNA ligase [Thermoanaerobaculia bacterium]|nr:histidine--tRNA ligase [Thermoanaerobaculia bacterium]